MVQLHFTGDTQADRLLSDDPFALLVGMLLDQQMRMEAAFLGPKRILDRLPGEPERIRPEQVAALTDEDLSALMAGPPAVHRYHGSMGRRVRDLAQTVVEEYGGDASAIWKDAADGDELFRRLLALPGFGEQKARIFIAVLGKRLDVRPTGWRGAAGEYGAEDVHRSVADVVDEASIAKVREFKQARKAHG